MNATTAMLMEALSGFEHKFDYAVYMHSGAGERGGGNEVQQDWAVGGIWHWQQNHPHRSLLRPIVGVSPLIPFGQPPGDAAARWDTIRRLTSHAQVGWDLIGIFDHLNHAYG